MRRGRAFYRDVVTLALPIVAQNLITTSLGLVDTFMVGALGEAPLAAVTLANIPVFVIQLVIFGLQSGSSVLISQYWGKGDRESINRVIGVGCYVAGAVSLLFALLMSGFPRQLMGLLTNYPALAELAADTEKVYKLELEDECCPLNEEMFENDALILDHGQISEVWLCHKDGTPRVGMKCGGFPNFGIWSVKNAPFVCLEPWMGRCDDIGFDRELSEKPDVNKVPAGGRFEQSYVIVAG